MEHEEPKSADFSEAYAEAQGELGRVNLAIFGRTGAGKSTLVNAIFQLDKAKTGIGPPVTHGIDRYVNDAGTLAVYDCEGFELGRSTRDSVKWIRSQLKDNRRGESENHIHVVWYCVQWSDRRLEDGQEALIRALSDLQLPVMFVLTQVAYKDDRVHPDAAKFAEYVESRGLPIVDGKAFLTDALGDTFSGSQVHGIQALLDATFRVVPEGKQAALVAAQAIDVHRKRIAARQTIAAAAAAASATGAVPIPIADAAVLVPLQVGLMARISVLYGLRLSVASQAAVAATSATTQAGRYIVASLLKLIPGAGIVISAATAGLLTVALGESWRVVCERFLTGELSESSLEDVKKLSEIFMKTFKEQLKKPSVALSTPTETAGP